jgi:hypothetical protein
VYFLFLEWHETKYVCICSSLRYKIVRKCRCIVAVTQH